MNHKRHCTKIPFINKGMEFIGLSSIFKDKSVTSAIPAYFESTGAPMICYKYIKSIRSTIFNFNKLVSVLDIDANSLIHETVRNPKCPVMLLLGI